MHTFLTGFSIDKTRTGYEMTLTSPMGDFTFTIKEVLANRLVDGLLEKIYDFSSLPIDDHQQELF